MSWIIILFILLARALQFYGDKKASSHLPSGMINQVQYVFALNAIGAFFAGTMVVLSGEVGKIDLQTIKWAALCGITIAIACLLNLYAMRKGELVLCALFSTAGLLIPVLAGVLFLNESIGWVQGVGMVLFLLALTLLAPAKKRGQKKPPGQSMLLFLGLMVVNGSTMLIQKLFVHFLPNGSIFAFSFLTFLIPVILLGGVIVYHQKALALPRPPADLRLFKYALLSGLSLFLINQLVTQVAGMLPGVVVFTIVSGGGMVIAYLMGSLVFSEKLNRQSMLGIIVGVVSLFIIQIV